MKFASKYTTFHSWKCIWKYCLWNGGHFVQGRWVNTLRPRQNGRHFADDTFKRIYLNETFTIAIKISLTFVPKGTINNIPALVQIMAWRRSGDKPLSEPMMVRLLTNICVTRPRQHNIKKSWGKARINYRQTARRLVYQSQMHQPLYVVIKPTWYQSQITSEQGDDLKALGVGICLIHDGWVRHICVSKLCHYCFR